MTETRQRASAETAERVRLPLSAVWQILWPYLRRRVAEQLKAVWLIVAYLVLFQTLVLDLPVVGAGVIAVGVVLVVVGLTFFMEGLLLGLMPLGEMIGVKLPRKSRLPTMLLFAFVLGVGATFAEPAVGILRVAGAAVMPWDAPLLFLLLNRHADALVAAVGAGVGVAVVFGMLRFLYGWSLKPFIYVLVPLLLGLSLWAAFDPNLRHLTGLAWDCGGVTTGPVTVPLVLALGIGVCRVVSRQGQDGDGSEAGAGGGGFGVVTLASAFPIVAVLALGMALQSTVPAPMDQADFLAPPQREQAARLFDSPSQMDSYVRRHASEAGRRAYFGDGVQAAEDAAGPGAGPAATSGAAAPVAAAGPLALIGRNAQAAVQAIVPLCVLFFGVLWFVLRERVPRLDELGLGIGFAVVGMTVFSLGIELGLSRLGTQVGERLPAAFKAIELSEQRQVIRNFDPAWVQTAVSPDGSSQPFFTLRQGASYQNLPYDPANLDPATGNYTHTPVKGPLFGGPLSPAERVLPGADAQLAAGPMSVGVAAPADDTGARRLAGMLVVLAFAFVMGYGATLAEPALNALGRTVEELSAGSFRKVQLMHAVALGVGVGMAFGVAKIVWDLPLIALLAPPYVLLLLLTWACSEEFVNIGWDSAGVTTGPITVPLVLAMGLGIGGQVSVVEGFGILAMASVYPIVAVLGLSLWLDWRRRLALRGAGLADA